MMGLDMMATHRLRSLEIDMMGLDAMAMHTQTVDKMGLKCTDCADWKQI